MFGNDSGIIAGKSNASRQYREPALRTSKTFQDSDIFGKSFAHIILTEYRIKRSRAFKCC